MLLSKEYNRNNAVDYALTWALGRNPAYYDFSDIGGDCTSFISQCIYAGCRVMNYTANGWYYNSVNDRAPAWTSVEQLKVFLTTNSSVGPHASIEKIEKAKIGDIIQLGRSDGSFYHSLIINAIADDIYCCAHTDDSRNRRLSTYSFSQLRLITIENILYWS